MPDEAYRRFNLGYDQTPGDYLATRSGGGTRAFAADPVFWNSVVAVCKYTKGALDQVLLYPIDMGYGRPLPQRGRPVLSTREVGDETLKWLQKVSEPFGTEISIVDGVGVIRL